MDIKTNPIISNSNKPAFDVEKNEGAHLKDVAVEDWSITGFLKGDDIGEQKGDVFSFASHFWNSKNYPLAGPIKIPRLFCYQGKLTNSNTGETHQIGQGVPVPTFIHKADRLNESIPMILPWGISGIGSLLDPCKLEKVVEKEGWLNDEYKISAPLESGNNVSLTLKPTKPPILLGKNGLVNATPNITTNFYQLPMLAQGTVVVDGIMKQVNGLLTMEHSWGPKDITRTAKAWDWSIINLGETQITAFKFWDENGKEQKPMVTMCDSKGNTETLCDATYKCIDKPWVNPKDHVRYPVKWQLEAPCKNISLTITATNPEQMMPKMSLIDPPYWEGGCKVEGNIGDKTLKDAYCVSGTVGHEKVRPKPFVSETDMGAHLHIGDDRYPVELTGIKGHVFTEDGKKYNFTTNFWNVTPGITPLGIKRLPMRLAAHQTTFVDLDKKKHYSCETLIPDSIPGFDELAHFDENRYDLKLKYWYPNSKEAGKIAEITKNGEFYTARAPIEGGNFIEIVLKPETPLENFEMQMGLGAGEKRPGFLSGRLKVLTGTLELNGEKKKIVPGGTFFLEKLGLEQELLDSYHRLQWFILQAKDKNNPQKEGSFVLWNFIDKDKNQVVPQAQYIDENGKMINLEGIEFKELEHWTSPREVTYPIKWDIKIPPSKDGQFKGAQFTVEAAVKEQEALAMGGFKPLYYGSLNFSGKVGENEVEGDGTTMQQVNFSNIL